MEKSQYEAILNQWKIYDEAERWSVKSFFQQECKNNQSVKDFKIFLEANFKSPSGKDGRYNN